MHQSHIIEVSGQFAGAAITHDGRFRFLAVDPRVEELNDSINRYRLEASQIASALARKRDEHDTAVLDFKQVFHN